MFRFGEGKKPHEDSACDASKFSMRDAPFVLPGRLLLTDMPDVARSCLVARIPSGIGMMVFVPRWSSPRGVCRGGFGELCPTNPSVGNGRAANERAKEVSEQSQDLHMTHEDR